MAEIEKNIPIEDLVQQYPWSVRFLAEKKIVCIQCGEPVWGSLEEAAHRAGIKDINTLINELNVVREKSLH
ncbi:DUF1858 domain-containing protein [candidate division CSSED10-310 bacterium]|uniref:DUF1858 domain-containing protein n=1 Tax=candidate division CSSED10-310 bacterium TaxID=2855610 RepID=A0ABV6YXJ6_UNCC1